MALIDVNWNPDRKLLRSFALISFVVFLLLGIWIWFRHKFLGFHFQIKTAQITAIVFWFIAGSNLLLRFIAPSAIKPFYITLTAITLPIGYVLSHIIMAFVYYIIITPIGIILKLSGKDLLSRKIDPQTKSYWSPASSSDSKKYFKQF